MEEKELIEKLSAARPAEVKVPGYRSQLGQALTRFARMKDGSPRPGRKFSLFTGRPAWQPVVAGVLVTAVVVGLAIGVPSLTGKDKPLSASEIALNSPEVQAALSGFTPVATSVLDKINTAGYSRVQIEGPWDKVVIAYVDVLNNRLVSVLEANIIEQNAADATDLQALEIVKSNIHQAPHLQALLDQGLHLYFMRFTVVFPDNIANPQSISGLPTIIFLKDDAWAKYYFFVDLNTGRVSGGGSDIAPLEDGTHFEFFEVDGLGVNSDLSDIFKQIDSLTK
jgi:hypothetical protein